MPDATWRALGKIDGFVEGASIFADHEHERAAYFVDGKEVLHPEDDGFEIRVTRALISAHRARLKRDPHVVLRRSGSDWLMTTSDAPRALVLELAALAADAHRPPAGVTAKPPPTGVDLARRRKLH